MVPTSKDIPIDWRVHLLPDAPNPVGVNSSKGTHRHTEVCGRVRGGCMCVRVCVCGGGVIYTTIPRCKT